MNKTTCFFLASLFLLSCSKDDSNYITSTIDKQATFLASSIINNQLSEAQLADWILENEKVLGKEFFYRYLQLLSQYVKDKENEIIRKQEVQNRGGLPCYDEYENKTDQLDLAQSMCLEGGNSISRCAIRRIIGDLVAIYTFEECLDKTY